MRFGHAANEWSFAGCQIALTRTLPPVLGPIHPHIRRHLDCAAQACRMRRRIRDPKLNLPSLSAATHTFISCVNLLVLLLALWLWLGLGCFIILTIFSISGSSVNSSSCCCAQQHGDPYSGCCPENGAEVNQDTDTVAWSRCADVGHDGEGCPAGACLSGKPPEWQ